MQSQVVRLQPPKGRYARLLHHRCSTGVNDEMGGLRGEAWVVVLVDVLCLTQPHQASQLTTKTGGILERTVALNWLLN